MVFHSRPDYTAVIHTTPFQPDIDVLTVTNMRVTTREIQQSIYLEFRIQDAGIREVSFLLPVGMEEARVTVPMLRQKIIESVEGDVTRKRMRLLLQDEITGLMAIYIITLLEVIKIHKEHAKRKFGALRLGKV